MMPVALGLLWLGLRALSWVVVEVEVGRRRLTPDRDETVCLRANKALENLMMIIGPMPVDCDPNRQARPAPRLSPGDRPRPWQLTFRPSARSRRPTRGHPASALAAVDPHEAFLGNRTFESLNGVRCLCCLAVIKVHAEWGFPGWPRPASGRWATWEVRRCSS